MDEEQIQDPHADLSDDDIASALGFSTTLSEPLLPQDGMDDQQDEGVQTDDESAATQQDTTEVPGNEVNPEVQNDKILSELEAIREEMKIVVAPKSVEQEVADIRKELESLKNEPAREDTSTGGEAQ